MQRILLLDNYDSFTFNLEHYLVSLGTLVDVVRNDEKIMDLSVYDKVVFSPGPGLPEDAKQMFTIMDDLKGRTPVLGVCLGMQAIAIYLGGQLYNQPKVQHGVSQEIELGKSILYNGVKSPFEVGLYHSWAVDPSKGNFTVTALSKEEVVMSIENTSLKLFGIQYHPESVMTKHGMKILENFLLLK